MILYDYCRSSASYRVRICLNLKALGYQQITVNLLQAAQHSSEHQQQNPQQLVPILVDKGAILTQSMAICEYLDEAYPNSYQILKGDVIERCKQRALAQAIACETSPINNLRVLNYLVDDLSLSQVQKAQWYQHWIDTTFKALEHQLKQRTDNYPYCLSLEPSLADICLVPQVYNAKRFDISMRAYPLLDGIYQRCQQLSAFVEAAPERQADFY
ncbi:maleylacetoacetate isomerase [Gammaproteobacteria bacterium AS21]